MTAGASEDLVLVHGLGSAASYWDNLRPALERRYRVALPNLPGHGPAARHLRPAEASPRALAEATIDVLRAAGLEQPHLVGLSLGGWVVLEMAALGYGASVVAFAPAGLWRPGARIRLEWKEALFHHMLSASGSLLMPLAHLPLAARLGLRTNVVDPSKVARHQFDDAVVALRQAKGYAVCDWAAVHNRFTSGPSVAVPCAVAFGDQDRVLTAETSQDQALVPPDTEWLDVAACGHAMTWDQPEVCLELIDRTVARTRSAA
jgi:pimeloyl-ACP methyl ester carboxylesterase